MKHLALVLTLVMACNFLQAQEKTKETRTFSKIEVEAEKGDINLQTGKIEEFSEGVKVTLSADESTVTPIVITSKTMTILSENGSSDVSGFVMKDDVKLKHSKGSISADNLEWSNSAGTLNFTGNAVADYGQKTPITADAIIYNLTTGLANVAKIRVGLPLKN